MNTTVKRLTRSNHDRVFGGVCGGLADYLDLDAVLVRVGFVALALLSGVFGGVLLYLFAWLIVPLSGEAHPSAFRSDMQPQGRTGSPKLLIGLMLAVAGVLALGVSFLPPFWHVSDWRIAGPVILIILGIGIIIWRRERHIETPINVTGAAGDEMPASQVIPESIPRPTRRLIRRHQNRKIAGVCAGLGEYLDIDPTLVRVIFLALLFAGGAGLLIYLIMWISMPLEP